MLGGWLGKRLDWVGGSSGLVVSSPGVASGDLGYAWREVAGWTVRSSRSLVVEKWTESVGSVICAGGICPLPPAILDTSPARDRRPPLGNLSAPPSYTGGGRESSAKTGDSRPPPGQENGELTRRDPWGRQVLAWNARVVPHSRPGAWTARTVVSAERPYRPHRLVAPGCVALVSLRARLVPHVAAGGAARCSWRVSGMLVATTR
jgi:hypothetical protein